MEMDTDRQLLEAWRGGDKKAGKRLFERHYDALTRFFRNKVGPEAPDLVQQTFLGCLERIDRFREGRTIHRLRGPRDVLRFLDQASAMSSCRSDSRYARSSGSMRV